MAARATFALKAGVWFRRDRLFIVSPDSRGTACPLSGRNSTYRPVQILEAGSIVEPIDGFNGFTPPQDLDVYLDSDGMTDQKQSNPAFDPTKPHQPNFFAGDTSAWWPDHGITVWMTRDAPAGVHYKLYVKIPQATDVLTAFAAPPATTVKSMALSDTWRVDLPEVTLSSARFWALVGTFTVKPDGKLEFKEATQAERDAEWTKLSKTAPPPVVQPTATGAPVMPFSDQSAQPRATPVSPEERERRKKLVEEMDKARKKAEQERQSPAATTPHTFWRHSCRQHP